MKNKILFRYILLPVIFLVALFYTGEVPQIRAMECTKEVTSGTNLADIEVIPGDVVCLHAGNYVSDLVPKASGTASQKIVFRAYPGDECKTGLDMTKHGCGVKLKNAVIDKDYIRIEGFMFDSPTANTAIAINANNVEIVNNYIFSTALNGITIGGQGEYYDNFLIENNELYKIGVSGKGGDGINLFANYVTLRKNYIHMVADDSVGFKDGASIGHLVEYNKIGGFNRSECPACHPDLFETYELHNFIIRYNTFFDLTQLIYLAPDSGMTVENGDIYGNVFYNEKYYLDEGGTSPAIFLEASKGKIKDVRIFSNTFGWLGQGPIQGAGNYSGIKIFGNIFYFRGPGNISALSDYNMYFTTDTDYGVPGGDTHSFWGFDPQLTNYSSPVDASYSNAHAPWDFSLKSGSPAIDKLTVDNFLSAAVTVPIIFLDQNETLRPMNGLYDVGAYEYRVLDTALPTPAKLVAVDVVVEGAKDATLPSSEKTTFFMHIKEWFVSLVTRFSKFISAFLFRNL